MPNLYTICYISRAADSLTDDYIDELLKYSSRYNNQEKINGILIYNDRNFLQVLEGNEDAIKVLYHKIAVDDRHDYVLEIFKGTVDYPIFLNYNCKFNLIDSKMEIASFKEYLRRNNIGRENDGQITKMLEPFL
jgi:hypothetical protein